MRPRVRSNSDCMTSAWAPYARSPKHKRKRAPVSRSALKVFPLSLRAYPPGESPSLGGLFLASRMDDIRVAPRLIFKSCAQRIADIASPRLRAVALALLCRERLRRRAPPLGKLIVEPGCLAPFLPLRP